MQKITIYLTNKLFFSNKNEAIALAEQSSIGEIKSGKVIYSIYEVLYLIETKKAELLSSNKEISFDKLIKRANLESYLAYKDLRIKGYTLKEGLKFGADFRVYDKGQKPGTEHAKYLLYALSGTKKLDIKDFSAKARIAHSTKKTLLLAIVDSEQDITYYEINWKSKE
jgi:tRNA-intron endonuclease